jgi:hypothetical protein
MGGISGRERSERRGSGRHRRLVTTGTIYVLAGGHVADRYEVCGGPPPGHGYQDLGGHTAGVTPAGHYVLDHAEHHVTQNWPSSAVPWGARIREHGEIIEFSQGGEWVPATGPHGRVTRAQALWRARSGRPMSLLRADQEARGAFFEPDGTLITTWLFNDFGKWSWNLRRHGHRTAYYVHTTPEDEAADGADTRLQLEQSHGCLHIQPADRDEMVTKGYLRIGIEVRITHYGLVGPPRPHHPFASDVGARS